jgi:ketosteroid isomerase-like protein
MKEWTIRAILVAALIALGIWSWGVFFPSPEKVIRKRLVELAKTASFSSKEGLVAKAWNANRLADFFTEDVEVTVELPGDQHTLSGRAELLQAAAGTRSRFSSLSVEFPDIKVTVAPDRTSAVVNLTARGKIPGERDYYLQELRMRMVKVKRDWLINQVETVKTLSLNSYLRGLPWGRPEPL